MSLEQAAKRARTASQLAQAGSGRLGNLQYHLLRAQQVRQVEASHNQSSQTSMASQHMRPSLSNALLNQGQASLRPTRRVQLQSQNQYPLQESIDRHIQRNAEEFSRGHRQYWQNSTPQSYSQFQEMILSGGMPQERTLLYRRLQQTIGNPAGQTSQIPQGNQPDGHAALTVQNSGQPLRPPQQRYIPPQPTPQQMQQMQRMQRMQQVQRMQQMQQMQRIQQHHFRRSGRGRAQAQQRALRRQQSTMEWERDVMQCPTSPLRLPTRGEEEDRWWLPPY